MDGVYQVFLSLAEKMNGASITGQFAKDIIGLVAALFGFWLLVMLALTPYGMIKGMFNRK